MEKKLFKIVAYILLALMVAVPGLFLLMPSLHEKSEYLASEENAISSGTSVLGLLHDEKELLNTVANSSMHGKQIRLTLPQEITEEDISVENNYVTQTISIKIKGVSNSYFNDYPMVGNSNGIEDIVYECKNQTGYIDLCLTEVKELETEFDGNYLYLGFVDPHEIYDYVVVVDAGHGGNVPGATKQGIKEKDIDLDIVLKLKQYFDDNDYNIGVYYTRLDDTNPDLENRVGLANNSNADLFLSIHNNSTASGRMSSICGTEVMYKVTDTTGESKRFADICLFSLLYSLGSRSKGTVAGDEVYIIRSSDVPVALVEVGFMTNKLELAALTNEDYQDRAAKALYQSCLKFLGLEEE